MKNIKLFLSETVNIVWNTVKICVGFSLIAGLLIPLVAVTLRILWDEFNFFWGLI